MPAHRSEVRWRRHLLLWPSVLLILTSAVVGYVFWHAPARGAPSSTSTIVDMKGQPVSPDDSLTAEQQFRAHAVEAVKDSHLVVPSVGLDVPLGQITIVDDQLTPPGFTSAYLMRAMGAGAGDPTIGTRFVVMHSLRGGGTAPGNYLIDVDSGKSRVAVGDKVLADGREYAITGSESILKNELPTRADVWANIPGRLVLITCLQTSDGKASTRNEVVYAQMTS